MANENPKPTTNGSYVTTAVTNDAALEVRMLRVDPSTGKLLVDAAVNVTGLPTAVTDGEAIDAADVGTLMMGTDGTNYQVIKTNSSGNPQVDVTSVVTGTGVTNLGKAKDSSISSGDVGVSALARLRYDASHSSGADGTYDTLDLTSWHELRTRDQRQIDIQNCNSSSDFTVLGNDTSNLANSSNHQFGTGAITFDKVNGAANTIFGGVSFAVSNINISSIFEDGAFVTVGSYLPSLTNVVYVFLRLGTNSSNYNEWRWDVADLTASTWQLLRKATGLPTAYAGNGWDSTNITYGAVGVAFSSETNTLSGIVIDHISFVGGRITDSTNNVAVTSSVTTPNINIQRVGGTATDTNSGVKSSGTLRVVLATDQPQLTNKLLVTPDANSAVNISQMNGVTTAMGTGASSTGTQRVVTATDSTIGTVTNLSQMGGVAIALNTGPRSAGTQRVTIATNDLVPVSDNSGSLTVDAPVGTPVFTTPTPSSTGGWTPKSLVALSNTKTAVNAAASTMGGYMFYNPNSSVVYIQVWNVAIGSITVGTTAPTYVIPIPATSSGHIEFTCGIKHGTEINVAATTTATGSTAPSTAIDGFMLYK